MSGTTLLRSRAATADLRAPQGYYRVRFEDVDHIMMVKIAEDNRGSTWDFAEDSRGDIPEVTSAERRPRSTMSRKSSYASFVNENWSDGSGGDSSPSKVSLPCHRPRVQWPRYIEIGLATCGALR